MKYTVSVLVALALVCTGGCKPKSLGGNEPFPTPSTDYGAETSGGNEVLPASLLEPFNVEFVSGPLGSPSFPSGLGLGPMIAIGDVTGDGWPEILLAMQAERDYTGTKGDAFWRHPVVLSWNGEAFEPLDADWLGISSYSQELATYLAQGLPYALLVTDLDRDGMNEIVVGTAPYRTTVHEKGAVYIFQWNGEQFMAEFSDYCLGAVYRLDAISQGDDTIVAVTVGQRRATDREGATGVCPQLPKGSDAPTKGLYALQASGPNEYRTWALTLDHALTFLVIGPGDLPGAQFVRLRRLPQKFVYDWASVRLIRYDGQVCEGDIPFEIKGYIVQMETVDLDGDGIEEIIVLVAKDPDKDVLAWQVFQAVRDHYQLMYEGPMRSSQLIRDTFAVGDADNDGLAEVIDDSGDVYKWVNTRLCYQANLIEGINEDIAYGLDSVYVEDVYGNGQNKIVFTRRYSSDGEPCLDCSAPRMYVVGMSSGLPVVECP